MRKHLCGTALARLNLIFRLLGSMALAGEAGSAPTLQFGPVTTNSGAAARTLNISNGNSSNFYQIDSRMSLSNSPWVAALGGDRGETNFSIPIGSEPSMFFRAVEQDAQTALRPIFQFAIVYNVDLEMAPGTPMTVTGPVHCNREIYLQPQDVLTFTSDVTAVGAIHYSEKPGDPLVRSPGTNIFEARHEGGVSPINLLLGTNSNNPATVREIVEMPPGSESAISPLGRQRLYNMADLIILVSNNTVIAKSGLVNNFGTTIPASQVNFFIRTNASFFNKRENKTIQATDIDIGRLAIWNTTNSRLRPVIATHDIRTIFVADQRTQAVTNESGVRLINGQLLLPKGLTVVTPNPLYIQGNYNAPVSALGTSNTSATLPAAIIADAITVLSPNWNDANSSLGLFSRGATDCTVNAAFLAGIVETANGNYSGGLENFPKFLENWAGRTFTYNGSMVVLYDSKYAIGAWLGTGTTLGIYNPPVRNWAFDKNFLDALLIPPSTPQVRVLTRY